MNLSESFPLIISAALITALAAGATGLFTPLLDESRKRREKQRVKIKELVTTKLSNGIQLNVQDVLDISRGAGSSDSEGIDAIYELYAAADNQEIHNKLKTLISDYNREEPFESFPEETRPSLARISALCDESTSPSDKELLHPIRKLIGEYQIMKRDHQSIKRQSWISYIIAIVSFFVGAIGLILAFQGPSQDFVSQEIRAALKEQSEENAAAKGDTP